MNNVMIKHENIENYEKLFEWLYAHKVYWSDRSQRETAEAVQDGLNIDLDTQDSYTDHRRIRLYHSPISADNEAKNEAIFKIKVLKLIKRSHSL